MAVNVPPVPDVETTAPGAVRFSTLVPPLRVPATRLQVPLKVWVNPAPRFNTPAEVPVPIVRPTPVTLLVKVAIPEALVITTFPPVVKPAIFCVSVVPLIVIMEVPALNVPLLIKSPCSVSP